MYTLLYNQLIETTGRCLKQDIHVWFLQLEETWNSAKPTFQLG